MISSLFFLKFNIRKLLVWLVTALLLGILAVFAYTPAPLGSLQYVRGEMPELFTLLGFLGESNLSTFVLSYLFGLVMPLLISGFCLHFSRSLISQPLEDGRMAMLLSSRHRKSAILLSHLAVMTASLLLLLLSAFTGQLAGALMFGLNMDVLSFLRLYGGFFCVALLLSAICFFVALTAEDDLQAKRRGRGFVFVMLLCLLLSRLPGWTVNLRYLSIWSLFGGFGLASGSGGFDLALIALCASLAFALYSLFAFQRREL